MISTVKPLRALAALMAAGLCTQAGAAKIDPATGEGAMTIARKIHGSTHDGEPVLYWWTGDVDSRVPGERDKLLFKVDGMNIRRAPRPMPSTRRASPRRGTAI
jgi:hypothetical protein